MVQVTHQITIHHLVFNSNTAWAIKRMHQIRTLTQHLPIRSQSAVNILLLTYTWAMRFNWLEQVIELLELQISRQVPAREFQL